MHKDYVSPVKSVGHGITCNADLDNEEEVFKEREKKYQECTSDYEKFLDINRLFLYDTFYI